jgi:short-subunit dehydrogenase
MALTTALVTGASSGIGYEISKLLAEKGHDLVLVARREKRLQQLADYLEREYMIEVTVYSADLSRPNTAQEIHAFLDDKNIPVDILVNNAGAASMGAFTSTDTETELKTIQLNAVAVTHMTKLFCTDMVKRGFGKVLNIASVSAFMPGPYTAVYNATKTYVLAFSEALKTELAGTGVSVTVCCPGPTTSEFHTVAGTIDINALKYIPMSGSAQVARAAVKAMEKRKTIEIPGIFNKLSAFVPRLLPRFIMVWIVKLIMKP